jgi:hypothetical protein
LLAWGAIPKEPEPISRSELLEVAKPEEQDVQKYINSFFLKTSVAKP